MANDGGAALAACDICFAVLNDLLRAKLAERAVERALRQAGRLLSGFVSIANLMDVAHVRSFRRLQYAAKCFAPPSRDPASSQSALCRPTELAYRLLDPKQSTSHQASKYKYNVSFQSLPQGGDLDGWHLLP